VRRVRTSPLAIPRRTLPPLRPCWSHRPTRSGCRRRRGVVRSPPRRNHRCTDPHRLHTSALSRHGRWSCSPVRGNGDSTSFTLFIITCLPLCSPSPLRILGPYIYCCPRGLFGFFIFLELPAAVRVPRFAAEP
jgi:hypothetical protein